MNDLRKAAEMALEALEEYTCVVQSGTDPNKWHEVVDGGKPAREAIKALRQALAQPEQEPVAFCNGMPAYEGSLSKAQRLTQDLEAPLTINGVPLYPKKEWVGLTRRELDIATLGLEDLGDCYLAIEAKLKEKNA